MKNYKTIRCGRGLGDSLYLQGVVRYLVEQGQRLHVMTDWPDIFKQYGDKIEIKPFTRERIDIIAHYTLRKRFKETTQFKDCCVQAGITENVDFKLDWNVQNTNLTNLIKKNANGKPILIVEMPRMPMNRTDNFAVELLPNKKVLQFVFDLLKPHYYTVLIGHGKSLYDYSGIDYDLRDKTTVSDLIDVASISDAIYGYCSFAVPLAESLNKKALFVWANKGLNSVEQFIRTITPSKILHKDTSSFVIDHWSEEKLTEKVNEFLRQGICKEHI